MRIICKLQKQLYLSYLIWVGSTIILTEVALLSENIQMFSLDWKEKVSESVDNNFSSFDFNLLLSFLTPFIWIIILLI